MLLDIDLSANTLSVEIALNDDKWNDQLRAHNYADWLAGAMYGAKFALRLAGVSAAVKIRRIVGTNVDTNPANIAAATADAVWKAVGFEIPQAIMKRISQAVLEGWELPTPTVDFD